jgi:hypothetical protein
MSEEQFAAVMAEIGRLREDLAVSRAETEALRSEVKAVFEKIDDRDRWLTGWQEIADHLKITMVYAVRLGSPTRNPFLPIPHERVGATVRAKKHLLDIWKLAWDRYVAETRSLAHMGPRQGKSRDGRAS